MALNTHASTATATATASYRRPARFTTLYRANTTDKAAVALLERSPQGVKGMLLESSTLLPPASMPVAPASASAPPFVGSTGYLKYVVPGPGVAYSDDTREGVAQLLHPSRSTMSLAMGGRCGIYSSSWHRVEFEKGAVRSPYCTLSSETSAAVIKTRLSPSPLSFSGKVPRHARCHQVAQLCSRSTSSLRPSPSLSFLARYTTHPLTFNSPNLPSTRRNVITLAAASPRQSTHLTHRRLVLILFPSTAPRPSCLERIGSLKIHQQTPLACAASNQGCQRRSQRARPPLVGD
jgi:hypothetical protein